MRILIGTDTYPPTVNGAAQFTQRLARGLARRGHRVHLLCPSPSGRADLVVDEAGLVLHRVRSFRYPGYRDFAISDPLSVHRAAIRAMDAAGPEVIHLQSGFVLGRALLGLARRRGVGVVATNHLMPENVLDHLPCPAVLRGPAARALWRDVALVYRHADVVTSPTPRAVELMYRNTGVAGPAVSNGIDTDHYRSARTGVDPSEVPVILFVGRLDAEKHLEDALRAISRLPADLPARLEVVGAGSQSPAWRGLARQLGLGTDRVVFHGRIGEAALLAAYRRASAFCMPGTAELQSLATLEAMAAGLPVLAADAMALPHLVRPGRNGFLFQPGDDQELAAQLTTLLRDRRLLTSMGAESLRLAARHDMERTLDSFERLYRQVRRGAPRPRIAGVQTRPHSVSEEDAVVAV